MQLYVGANVVIAIRICKCPDADQGLFPFAQSPFRLSLSFHTKFLSSLP